MLGSGNQKATVSEISRVNGLKRKSALVKTEPWELYYQSSRPAAPKPSLTADLLICRSVNFDWLLCGSADLSAYARPKQGMVEMHVTGRRDVWALVTCARAPYPNRTLSHVPRQPCIQTVILESFKSCADLRKKIIKTCQTHCGRCPYLKFLSQASCQRYCAIKRFNHQKIYESGTELYIRQLERHTISHPQLSIFLPKHGW